ncbi:hypothetical protein P879_02679 [Paragonimus westermani]|uniref:Large ribosomal subunit protein eL6 n=1 Tax=Paragonimus westermani TaxID=34504 RepID=A0A8T0DQQ1_9TREM|nr:hypothetical protein P879_02679 [Paragonimus westermani]
MAEFRKCFHAIDVNNTGRITAADLREYTRKMNHTEKFVQSWMKLFHVEEDGFITYENYCKTLGLIPKKHETTQVESSPEMTVVQSEPTSSGSTSIVLQPTEEPVETSQAITGQAPEVKQSTSELHGASKEPESSAMVAEPVPLISMDQITIPTVELRVRERTFDGHELINDFPQTPLEIDLPKSFDTTVYSGELVRAELLGDSISIPEAQMINITPIQADAMTPQSIQLVNFDEPTVLHSELSQQVPKGIKRREKDIKTNGSIKKTKADRKGLQAEHYLPDEDQRVIETEQVVKSSTDLEDKQQIKPKRNGRIVLSESPESHKTKKQAVSPSISIVQEDMNTIQQLSRMEDVTPEEEDSWINVDKKSKRKKHTVRRKQELVEEILEAEASSRLLTPLGEQDLAIESVPYEVAQTLSTTIVPVEHSAKLTINSYIQDVEGIPLENQTDVTKQLEDDRPVYTTKTSVVSEIVDNKSEADELEPLRIEKAKTRVCVKKTHTAKQSIEVTSQHVPKEVIEPVNKDTRTETKREHKRGRQEENAIKPAKIRTKEVTPVVPPPISKPGSKRKEIEQKVVSQVTSTPKHQTEQQVTEKRRVKKRTSIENNIAAGEPASFATLEQDELVKTAKRPKMSDVKRAKSKSRLRKLLKRKSKRKFPKGQVPEENEGKGKDEMTSVTEKQKCRFPKSFTVQPDPGLSERTRHNRRRGLTRRRVCKEKTETEQKIERRKKMLALKPSRTVKRWKVRPSLRIPGVLLILLAGRHRGKRVVCLGRQQSTGLLVVTGPYRYNGCPLRRVHPNMVIATRTRISLEDFELPRRLHQKDYFARKQTNKTKSLSDASIFLDKEKDTKYEPDETRKQDQKTIDEVVCKAIKAHPDSSMLVKYLKSLFSLGKHDRPHKMLF